MASRKKIDTRCEAKVPATSGDLVPPLSTRLRREERQGQDCYCPEAALLDDFVDKTACLR